MTEHTLDGRLSAPVTIDLCLACQAFWFDGYESLRLSPGAVLTLFRLIGEQTPAKPAALAESSECPRCRTRLGPAHDMQRNTRFQYLRCPLAHGRLITFFNFLREKDFIRPLSKEQIDELRRNVQAVNCSNCGAPVDLAAGSICAHCGAPLSMLDMRQAQALVTTLRDADAHARTIDPALPLQLEQAKREVESAFASFEQRQGWFEDVSTAGLVGAGLSSIARWLKDRT
jgi:hypothetical protein